MPRLNIAGSPQSLEVNGAKVPLDDPNADGQFAITLDFDDADPVAPGKYRIELQAVDSEGATSEVAIHELTITARPTVNLVDPPAAVLEGTRFALQARGATAEQGRRIVRYIWSIRVRP